MKTKINGMLKLNLMLMVYSMSSIFSKKASECDFFSRRFLFLYVGMILILAFYAICWQQIIKVLPLTLAFANKAITVIWGLIWGVVFFNERITVGKLCGASFVIVGIVLFVMTDRGEDG